MNNWTCVMDKPSVTQQFKHKCRRILKHTQSLVTEGKMADAPSVGNLRVLLIRAKFTDEVNEPISELTLINNANKVKEFYQYASYGR